MELSTGPRKQQPQPQQRKDEFKRKLKAMRLRMKLKREKFVQALALVEQNHKKKPCVGVVTVQTSFIQQQQLQQQDIDTQHDTLRSMEVSFGLVTRNVSNPKSSASSISRTSTPICVKQHQQQQQQMMWCKSGGGGDGKSDCHSVTTTTTLSSATSSFLIKSSSSRRKSNQQPTSGKTTTKTTKVAWPLKKRSPPATTSVECHAVPGVASLNKKSTILRDMPCKFDYFAYSKTLCQFQDFGEFKVWFV
jgi:hypothetical protein